MVLLAPPAIVAITETPMVRVPGGGFNGKVIKPFYLDKTHVTVAQFRAFVKATHYVTEMEQIGKADVRSLETWEDTPVKGACWHHPEGPTKPAAPANTPVVQVTYADALAYAEWAGKRLPTAAEYEWAMRGGLVGKTFAWGDEELPGGRPMANYWHGPMITGKPAPENLVDPYLKIAPIRSFPPNGFGLYDMAGNAWAITSTRAGGGSVVTMGGSWRCSMVGTYVECCMGFACGTRQSLKIGDRKFHGVAADNIGFRCVQDILVAGVARK